MPKFLSLHERANEFKSDGFYVFDENNKILMCKFCDSRIEWMRKDTCKKHVQGESHKRKKELHLKNNVSPKQLSILSAIDRGQSSKQNKQEFILDFTNMLLGANIPLEKADDDSVRTWLKKYVPGAGDIPTARVLRETYLPKIGEASCEQVKRAVENQKVVLLADETTDKMGRCIFIIFVRILTTSASGERLFVGGVKELDCANGTECSRAILSVLANNDIKYENVVAVVSDSARYMAKCVNTLQVVLSENLVHVQCWAHKLNLVASLWSLNLSELNTFVSNVKHAFLNSRKRKHRYKSFLEEKYPENEKNVKLFPSPVLTRWNSWFHSVEYVAEYEDDLIEFLTSADSGISTEYFSNLSNCERAIIQCSAEFLVEHGTPLIKHIVELEGSSYTLSHKLYPLLWDLENSFLLVSRGVFGDQTCAALSKLPTAVKKGQMSENLKSVGLKCATKLQNLKDNDSAKQFFTTVSNLYSVRNVANNQVDDKLFAAAKTLPVVTTVTRKEFLEGYLAFQTQTAKALEESSSPSVDVCQILQGLKNDHTNFVSQALSILWIPASNVDCERGFSSYGHIFSDLRTSLKTSNIEIMLGKYFSGRY